MIQPNTENLFGLYDKIPVHQISTIRNPAKGVSEDTTLSKVFFSKENTSIIQNGIRAGVYKLSNGKYLVDNQDPEELQLIMRGISNTFNIPNINIPVKTTRIQNLFLNSKKSITPIFHRITCAQQHYQSTKSPNNCQKIIK